MPQVEKEYLCEERVAFQEYAATYSLGESRLSQQEQDHDQTIGPSPIKGV